MNLVGNTSLKKWPPASNISNWSKLENFVGNDVRPTEPPPFVSNRVRRFEMVRVDGKLPENVFPSNARYLRLGRPLAMGDRDVNWLPHS